jgi:hypothetical protein
MADNDVEIERPTVVYRQVIDGRIVNRIVVDAENGLPDDFPGLETYELETEDPPPQIGWVEDGDGEFREPLPEMKPAE